MGAIPCLVTMWARLLIPGISLYKFLENFSSCYRFNTGLTHQGEYLQMALTIGVANRIPSAHLRFHHDLRLHLAVSKAIVRAAS